MNEAHGGALDSCAVVACVRACVRACVFRTASAIKIKRMQGPSDGSNLTTATTTTTADTAGFGAGMGIGIDMASDAADESADRALTSVRRKLDQSLSIEYTVNELITTATDPTNLSQIFVGEFFLLFFFGVNLIDWGVC